MSIIQNLTKKIGELLSGEPAKKPITKGGSEHSTEESAKLENIVEKVPVTEEKKPLPNSVETRGKIKKSTLTLLNSLYLANPEICKTKHLIVWFDTDTITFNSYSDFRQELENYWAVESGYVFEKVELKQGKPQDEKDARKVDSGVETITLYLQEEGLDRSIVKKACIAVFGGKGSLLQEQYELSSETLEKEHRKYYNIGRGEYPDMEGGSYRQNHIAVDDKSNVETNRFVSRAHARIGYSDSIGFFLQVEYGGSRLSGNRTRIFRGEDKIEVENVDVKEPLQDGDLIELGKAVVLKFNEISG